MHISGLSLPAPELLQNTTHSQVQITSPASLPTLPSHGQVTLWIGGTQFKFLMYTRSILPQYRSGLHAAGKVRSGHSGKGNDLRATCNPCCVSLDMKARGSHGGGGQQECKERFYREKCTVLGLPFWRWRYWGLERKREREVREVPSWEDRQVKELR